MLKIAGFSSVLVALLTLFAVPPAVSGTKLRNKLLIVSFDGFRRDYLDRGLTPTLQKFIDGGVMANDVTPVFPTFTQPCHYTMVTGRHPDHHGVVANTFLDPELGFFFEGRNEKEEYWTYNKTEPLWITAKKQGLTAVSMGWVGSHVNFTDENNKQWQADDYIRKTKRKSWDVTVKRVFEWFDKGADLAMLYHNQPDKYGHKYGPDNETLNETLVSVDAKFKTILHMQSIYKLEGKVNIVIVADHGMMHVEKVVNLGIDYNISQSLYFPWTFGGMMFLDASHLSDARYLYEKLKVGAERGHFDIYPKEQVPAHFNYGKNPRVSDLVLIGRSGVQLRPGGSTPKLKDAIDLFNFAFCRWQPKYPRLCNLTRNGLDTVTEIMNGYQTTLEGTHGNDNLLPSMTPIFAASGPDFREGAIVPHLNQVDYYELFASLLRIKPQPNDGSFDNIKAVLRNPNNVNQLTTESGESRRRPEVTLAVLLPLLMLIHWFR